MKKLLITVAAVAGMLGAGIFFSPAQADPTSECSTTAADTIVCVDTDPITDAPIEGGRIEANLSPGSEKVIVDGDNENNVVGAPDDPFSGYIGVSGGTEPVDAATTGCMDDDGPDTNTGGCYGVKGIATIDTETLPGGATLDPLPQPVCGDDTGGYTTSSRDGCRVP